MIILLITDKEKFLNMYSAQTKQVHRAFNKKAAKKHEARLQEQIEITFPLVLIVSVFFLT